MKDIIESLNAKILQEKLTKISQYKFEVPIEEIFDLPKKEETLALSFHKQNNDKSPALFGKQLNQEKHAPRAIFGAKPNLAALAAQKEFFKNPFAKTPEIKISSPQIFSKKNKNEETNITYFSSNQAEETEFPEAKKLMEDLELNEAESAQPAANQKAYFKTNSVIRRESDCDSFAFQNFTPEANLLVGNENNKKLLNFKFDKLNNFNNKCNYNTNEHCETNKNNSISNLNIIRSNEKNNLFSFTNNSKINNNKDEDKNAVSAFAQQKHKFPLLTSNQASKSIPNPFREKVKMLFNKRNSNSEKSGNSAFNPFERFARQKTEYDAYSANSKDSTEDDASSIDNCVLTANANEDLSSFNSLFSDPLKYNKLLQSVKME